MAAAGDVNGDGFDDVLVGASSWRDNGRVEGRAVPVPGRLRAQWATWVADPADYPQRPSVALLRAPEMWTAMDSTMCWWESRLDGWRLGVRRTGILYRGNPGRPGGERSVGPGPDGSVLRPVRTLRGVRQGCERRWLRGRDQRCVRLGRLCGRRSGRASVYLGSVMGLDPTPIWGAGPDRTTLARTSGNRSRRPVT